MDDAINQVLEFTLGQLNREEAVAFLRISGNDPSAAVNKFYDEGKKAIDENSWDQSAWHADRYGQQEDVAGSNIPSFNIEYAPGVDHYPHSGAASVAPSRPPSRTSNHSGISPAHIGDTPMQSIETGQESGVTGNSKPVFGPANRSHYEENQWALVPSSSSAEYIPDVAPTQRQREDGVPAIIKPLPNEDYLPALVAILHSIPLCRNILLAADVSLSNYRVGDDWWKGGASAQARTIEYTESMEANKQLEILHETQRLMAFLDSTNRAYGSVGGLQQLDAFKDVDLADSDLLRFFMAWGSAYEKQTSNRLTGVLKSKFKAAGQDQESFLLDATVVHDDSTIDKTLYDVLDNALFDASSTANAHIVELSDVLVFRLSSSKLNAKNLDCKFPATFYADRYLEENKSIVDEMFQHMGQYREQLTDLNGKVSKLKYHSTKKIRPGEQMETLKLLKTSMVAFQPKEDDLIEDPRNAQVLSQLQSVYNNIEHKLNVLEEQKKKAREALDNIASRFRAPFDDGSDTAMELAEEPTALEQSPSYHQSKHPYKLCGVSTRPNVYYFLHPNPKSSDPSVNQWWRIEYHIMGTEAAILSEKTSLSSVLEKASKEHNSALLVYANENAISAPPISLSEPLDQFVKNDNIYLMEEQQGGWEQQPEGAIEPIGGWPDEKVDENPPTYVDDWAHYGGSTSVFGNQFYDTKANKNPFEQQSLAFDDDGVQMDSSGMSSATLTPNTEFEDEGLGGEMATEMQEVNGGIAAWAGGMSNTSSETVGRETREVGDQSGSIPMSDIDMEDVELGDKDADVVKKENEEPRAQHVEMVEEKKGG